MQQVACPGCGAPVPFKSAASVMAVCEFCKTTLLKDAASITNLGKMSEVLEDYSPLQIGSSGVFSQRSFSLIGRIQLQYSDGFWNEWYALFDDGTNGWLSDASGQFAVTFRKPTPASLPLFDKLSPGRPLTLSGQVYTASDVRTARCTGGQGELPFKVGQGWEARVADFRSADRFLSLDYSDEVPKLYAGQAVKLADLLPQLLRDPDKISDASGRFHGKVSALVCPSCGAPVSCVTGVTVHLVCPSCHAEVDTRGAVATVLAAGARVDRVHFTFPLGAAATIDGARYTLLGAMRRAAGDAASQWSEYLMYSPGRAFVWLVETSAGWQRAEVLDRWPQWDGAGQASLEGRYFTTVDAYAARVIFAAGSFNWRVRVGDTAQVTEFSASGERLAVEASNEELTWSRSVAVSSVQLREWFAGGVKLDSVPQAACTDTARRILIFFAIVNAIPVLFAADESIPWALLGAVAIYFPAYLLDKLEGQAP